MFIHFLKIFCHISYLLDYACVKSCFCTPDRTLTCINIFRRDASNTIRPQEHNAGCFKIYIPNLSYTPKFNVSMSGFEPL